MTANEAGMRDLAQVENPVSLSVIGAEGQRTALIGTCAKLDDVGTSGRGYAVADLRRLPGSDHSQINQP